MALYLSRERSRRRRPTPASRRTVSTSVAAMLALAASSVAVNPSAVLAQSAGTTSPASAASVSSTESTSSIPNASLVGPVIQADAQFTADRAVAWSNDSGKFLFLEGEVRFHAGAYGFTSNRALIRIDRHAEPNHEIRDLTIYFDDAQPWHGPNAGPVSAAAPRLLVTVATRGGIKLTTDLLHRARTQPANAFVAAGLARIDSHRQALAQPLLNAPDQPLLGPEVSQRREERRAAIAREQAATKSQISNSKSQISNPQTPTPNPQSSVLPTAGAVYLSADRIAGSPKQNAVMLIGHVRVVYQDYEHDRQAAITAQNAVIFTQGNVAQGAATHKLEAASIQGVYLEQNVVITNGQFTVRAPRMYFDLARNKAILLNAVAYTYDIHRRIPLYLRAKVIRQTSANSLEADHAILTTSEFAKPLFAIAADRVTIQRLPGEPASAGGTTSEGNAATPPVEKFTASGSTIRIAGVPVFYWPYLAGENHQIPLRRIGLSHDSDNGMQFASTWDLFALAGQPRPRGVDMLLRTDYLGDHGPALGVQLDYSRDRFFGNLNSYLLPKDNGTDRLAKRRDIDHDDEVRGFIHWQHRQYLTNGFELSLETSYLSDDTFLEEYFRDQAFEAREYQTDAYLKKQEDDWALTLLAKYNLNDFTPQLTTLQTPGYTVDKLPELGYYRVGKSFWDDRLTYFSENRLSRMRLRFGEDSPAERGFGANDSPAVFGIAPNVSFADAADAAGLPDDWRYRFDTRHEIDAPMTAGILDITPYIAARLTAYDTGFEGYAGNDDQLRLWGALGTRVHTQFSRVYDHVESQLFDVHRLRHLIEPRAEMYVQGATLDAEDLPVYDTDVEDITDGPGIRLGLTNTLQTQRGGAGRRRSVDWIVLRTDLVFRDDSGDDRGQAPEDQLPTFLGYRPEFSSGGNHFYTQLLWMVSDTLGVSGDLIYNFESHSLAQARVGVSLKHTPRLTSFIDYERINPLDLELLSYGVSYQLTDKYRVRFTQQLDLSGFGSRRLSFAVDRSLPHWIIRVVGDYDQIDGDTTIGVVLIPEGLGGDSSALPF